MRNPLNESPGKGSDPRNCHTPKFRKNYDKIKWRKCKYKLDFVVVGTKKEINKAIKNWSKKYK